MPMLKTCSRCGGLHDMDGSNCPAVRVKGSTEATRFRDQRRWKQKSLQIRERDHHLCQVCIINAFDTYRQFTYTDLEVNHIIPLEELAAAGQDLFIAGLNDANLLTMCAGHHKLADAGGIPRQLMLDLAANNRDYGLIGRRLKRGAYPPASKV